MPSPCLVLYGSLTSSKGSFPGQCLSLRALRGLPIKDPLGQKSGIVTAGGHILLVSRTFGPSGVVGSHTLLRVPWHKIPYFLALLWYHTVGPVSRSVCVVVHTLYIHKLCLRSCLSVKTKGPPRLCTSPGV